MNIKGVEKMKMDNKGFAITGIVYSALLLFLVLLAGILSMMATRKVILDKIKKEIEYNLNK